MHPSGRESGSIVNFLVMLIAFGAVVSMFIVGVAYLIKDLGGSDSGDRALSLDGAQLTLLTVDDQRTAAESLAKWFREETGARVSVVDVPFAELLSTVYADAESGAPRFDAAAVWYPDLGRLASEGLVVDLSATLAENPELEAELDAADFLFPLYDAYTLHQGSRFGLPFDGETHFLYYRPSLLAKYGFETAPATWEEYLAAAEAITDGEGNSGTFGAALMGLPSPLAIVSSYVNRLSTYGGELVDETGRPTLDSPEALAALTAMVEHYRHALPSPLETDEQAAFDAFLSGRVAMVEHWSGLARALNDPARSALGEDWAVAPLPGASQALNGGYTLTVLSASASIPETQAFVFYAARPDVSRRLCALDDGLDPVRESALASDGFSAAHPQVSEAARLATGNATAWPTDPASLERLNLLAENLAAALAGDMTAEKALQETQEAWSQ